MASIVNERAVRETRDRSLRGGKNLVYGIGNVDPKLALRIHHWVYDHWLGDVGRAEATAKKMRQFLEALSKEPDEKRWKLAAQGPGWASYSEARNKTNQKLDEEPLASNDIAALIKSFNHFQALNHFLPYLPGKTNETVKRNLVLTLLKNKTLNPANGGDEKIKVASANSPFVEYRKYLSSLRPDEIAYARQKFREIQQLLAQGQNWLDYFQFREIRKIDQVDATHVKGYIPWRKKNSRHKTWYGDVSDRMIRAELKYFVKVADYGATKEVLIRNPAKNISIPKHRITRVIQNRVNEPLSLKEVRELVELLNSRLTANIGAVTFEETKLNVLTIFFLLLTGCRPKEAGQFSVKEDFIIFHRNDLGGQSGGKTKYSSRKIRITPGLKMIVKNGAMEKNKDSIDLGARIHQYLTVRCRLKKITPYRIRHTVSTIRFKAEGENAPQIAYELGHSDPTFSYQRYTNLDAYSGCSAKEARDFWNWLHNKAIKLED